MKLSDIDLVAIIQAHRKDALGVEDGDLSNHRAKAMDRYHGRPMGNEVTGRSSVVSRDLQESVDWVMPAIMKVFIQSGNIAEFEPVGPEDEQQAQQESDYVNQVLMKDNAGFMILHDAVKDTLLLKNGYVKHFWEETEKTSDEEYTGLSMEQIQQLLAGYAEDEKVEVIGQDSKQVTLETPMGPQQVELFDIKIRCTKKVGKLATMAVPTEEVRVSKKCRGTLQDSPFVEHVTKKTRSALIEMGMPRDFVDELPAHNEQDNDSQSYSRDTVTDESNATSQSIADRAMDEIEYCEAYIRVDADDDGIAELRCIVTVANKIPPGEEWNKTIEAVPLTGFVMKRVPHRHVGESLDDELADLQEIKTVLHRQLLDNVYLTNNARTVVNENVNLKDLLTSTPGGVIRVRGQNPVGGDFAPFVTLPIIDKLLPAIDYWDRVKEGRTGLTKASTGMDPDILRESTKGAFMENLNRASQKVEMITRMLAESGVKEWVLQSHAILVRHQDKSRMVQLRGKWVEVNPREWKNRTDLSVRVGLGTGNEEEKRQKLMMVAQFQDRAGPQGMVGPSQLYNLSADIVKALGFDMAEKYFIAPGTQEWQQLQQQRNSKPDPAMAKVQAEMQAKQQQMQMQTEVDKNRQTVEAQQQQARLSMEMELGRMKAQMQMELERMKAQMQAQVQIEIARINAAAKIDAAQLSAQTVLDPMQEMASDNAVNDNDGDDGGMM